MIGPARNPWRVALLIGIFGALAIIATAQDLITLQEDDASGCSDKASSVPIVDPSDWVARCLLGEDDCALVRFEQDLDADGTPELFISCREAMGNAGGTFFCFRNDGKTYRSLGSLFLHPMAFRVLAPEVGKNPTMIVYHRMNAAEGTLETVEYAGGEFRVTAREKMQAGGADSSRYRSHFADLPARARATDDVLPSGLGEVHPDEEPDVTFEERMSFPTALECVERVNGGLDAFATLIEEARKCLSWDEIRKIPTTDWETQNLGLPNAMGAVEGTLRRQQRRIRKLEYDLAIERRKTDSATDAEVAAAAHAYARADSSFRAFWKEFGIAD